MMTVYLFSTALLVAIVGVVLPRLGPGQGVDILLYIAVVLALALASGLLGLAFTFGAKRAVRRGMRVAAAPELTAFAENLSTPAVLLDNDALVFVNGAFLKHARWEHHVDEIVGMPFGNLVHPQSMLDLTKLLAQAGDDTERTEGSLRLAYGDGTFRRHPVTVLRGRGSRLTLLQFPAPYASADVQRSEAQIQQHCQDVVAHLPQALFRIDREQNLIFVNPAWRSMLRIVGGGSDFPPLAGFVHPEDRAALSARLTSLIDGQLGELITVVRMIRADETMFHVELRCKSVADAEGQLIGAVGLALDVSNSRRNEEALHASRRSLRMLLSNVRAMIYRGQNNRHWSMEFVSEGCFELTGYEANELLDESVMRFVSLIHPEDREFVWNEIQSRVAVGEPYEVTYRIVDRAGQTKWVWDQGRGIFSARNELLGLEGFIIEVTRRQLAEESTRRRLVFDRSTGLTNSAMFMDRLSFAIAFASRSGQPCAVLAVRMSDFEKVTGRFGAEYADRVLVELGRRLQAIQGDMNCATLLDKQDFAIMLTDFSAAALGWCECAEQVAALMPNDSTAALDIVAECLRVSVGVPVRVEGHEFCVTAQVGWALAQGESPRALEMLDSALASGEASGAGRANGTANQQGQADDQAR
ncbi:PAS domain-containing protein [Paraburkholderia sp. EG287B]|uniref:PAS domain-containing protein n=1 Tax=Paraburkholderia sp. EG287B TaxID=3237010 RepID=UPI0034D34279